MQPIKATCEGTRIEVHFASIQEFEVEFKKNIQAGGLLLAIDSPPPLHTDVEVRLLVLDQQFTLPGKIVWLNPQAVGIQFAPLNDSQKQAMR